MIEKYTGNIFDGWDFEQAQDFIKRYYDKSVEIAKTPTERQKKAVYAICKQKKITHNCKTKRDYSDFITRYSDTNYIR